MELIETKLNSNNPIVVAQVISSIVKSISKQLSNVDNAPELKFLNDKCINDDPLISEVACSGILYLIEEDILDVDSVLHDFITKISTAKCFSGITNLLGRLLYLELRNNLVKNKNVCQYNLRFPQHPFVTLLHEHTNSWNSILDEIELFHNNRDESISMYKNKLFRPIYLYAICNPGEPGLNIFKERLWRFVLNADSVYDILIDILCWLPVESKSNIILMGDILTEALRIVKTANLFNILVLWQVSVLYYLILHKFNPRKTIRYLQNIILNNNTQPIVNNMLYIITKSIGICSSVYLEELLCFCNDLINNYKCDIFALCALKSAIIHLIANGSLLNEKSGQVAKQIYSHIENNKLNYKCDTSFGEENKNIIRSNREVFLAVKLNAVASRLSNKKQLEQFLKHLNKSPQFHIKSINYFIYGLFLQNNPPDIEQSLLEVILKNTQMFLETSPETLSIILFKLSKTTNPKLHLHLLQTLPKMLVFKDNYNKVVATILALSKGPARLQNCSALLMFEIWKIDDRSYTDLENILMMNCTTDCNQFEFYTTRAYILKEICELRPEKYGKEIVAHFSNILNKHSGENGVLACSLAIDGIRSLCKAEIIDAITTWANLSPKFKDDTRAPIIVSLCKLIHEIPLLPYTDAYPQLVNEVVAKLWTYVMLTNEKCIMEAALDGLTSFSLEQISMQMPDEYLDPDTLEIKENSVVGKPHIVPGKTWIHLLKYVQENNLNVIGNFLIKMVSIEISNYLKFVYQVKGNNEPIHFTSLPTHSIVRGIGDYLKQWLTKWKSSHTSLIYIECLRIFSQEYSKPLPPFNWHFLLELIEDPRVRHYCIDIASHQVILSGSARQIIENMIEGCSFSKNVDDIVRIYKNLVYLANSLQPITLKPFFENSLKIAIESFKTKNDRSLLNKILDSLMKVLKDKAIQDINKSTIAEVVLEIMYNEEIKSPIFNILLDMTPVLPEKYIEKVTNSSNCNTISQVWFERSLIIRCKVAELTDNTPMNYLEEILDIVCNNKIENATTLTLARFVSVFRNQIDNTDCALWLLELIGKIQARVASRIDKESLAYLFDVFILAVVVFSGYFMFFDYQHELHADELFELFPQGFTNLLQVDHWSICTNQGLEWLYYINSENYIPIKYRNIFGVTLQALRNNNEFTKNLKWMKYFNCEIES